MCPFPSPHPLLAKRRGRDALPAPQPVPGLAVGVSRVVARAARDKGCLSDARADLGRRFPDAWPASDSRPGGPQRPTSAPRTPPPRRPGRAAPGGRKWGGARGGAESTFPLKPRRNVGGFPETRPRPPAGPPPLTWTCSLGNGRRGAGAHLGGQGQVLLPLPPQAASCSGKGGWMGGNQTLSLLSCDLDQRPNSPNLSFPFSF